MNKKVDPGWTHFAKYTFSPGIERDGWLYISGATASGENGEPGGHARRLAAVWRSRQLILRFAALCAADRHTGGTCGWGD